MKSETDVRQELDLSEKDLKIWRDKLERCSASDSTRRTILANTIVGIEGRTEALKWVLEEG